MKKTGKISDYANPYSFKPCNYAFNLNTSTTTFASSQIFVGRSECTVYGTELFTLEVSLILAYRNVENLEFQ